MAKRFFIDLYHGVMKHNIGSLAAVIAFFGFSSLIPSLTLIISAASIVVPEDAVGHVLHGILKAYVPALPTGSDFMESTIGRLTEYRNTSLSVIGVAGLLWSTIGGFVSLQQILDTIFEVKRRRSFLLQYVVGFAMMGVLLSLTVASAIISIVTPTLLSRVVFSHTAGWLALAHIVSKVAFMPILFATCYGCFRILPSRKLKWPPLVIGAALATVAIYVSRSLFVLYTHHLGNYKLMYGTLTFVTLLTFWIYVVCMILLFSAQIAVVVDNLWRAHREDARPIAS